MFRTPWKTGGEVLNEGIQNLMERLMKEKQMQNESEYRNATLNIAQQNANRQEKTAEVNRDLLKAKVQKLMRTGSTAPTNAFITQNQKTIQAIDNTIPQLKEIMDSGFPGQLIGKYLHPDKQAAYEAKGAGITDALISALQLPKTNESIELTKKMITEKPFESRDAYKKRIQGVIDDLNRRRDRHVGVLESGQSFSNNNTSNESSSATNASNNTGTIVMQKKNEKTGKVESYNIPQDAETQKAAIKAGFKHVD